MLAIKYIPVLHMGKWLFSLSVSGSRELTSRTVKDFFLGGVSAINIVVTMGIIHKNGYHLISV